ncbi:MAG: glycosyl hydrolase 115 family protein [Bacteroidales bacterium]
MNRWYLLFNFFFVGIYMCSAIPAPDDSSFVSFHNLPGYFPLVSHNTAATLIVSANDYKGVQRAVNDLKDDIKRVTDISPMITHKLSGKSKNAIIIGTLGQSEFIQQLINQKIISVEKLKGKWESYAIITLKKPLKGIDHAMVIVGSDKRGTIYGIYNLSANIGVSPWYWWADIPVLPQKEIYVKPLAYYSEEPKVKYRGIFINDEEPALGGWVREKFGGFNHKFYEKVFELILRLRGNYLWPAMWGKAFFVDDTLNGPLADEYGIVIGTSHHEPLLRAHVEWQKFGHGAWNYQTNDSTLRDFWRKSLEQRKNYETILTIGMRGDGDEPMTENANIALLERIVKDQRSIIEQVTKKNPADVPQLWALYKEVQDYYDHGMRVPDDVILLLCDDNWGNIRKLPLPSARKHPGGYGIYYHFDYVGGPRNYKWLNTNQIERTWEQMHMAYEYGVNKLWIVNVGDLKPMEFPIEFFLDLAWNPEKWNADNIDQYTIRWAEHYFGERWAPTIATGIKLYTKYNSRRKPELLSSKTFNLIHYREAERIVKDYEQLYFLEKSVYDSLPQPWKDAFYQLVLHPIEACSNLYKLYFSAAKNEWYYQQQRSTTNRWADSIKYFFMRDQQITEYYNHQLANGKWNHFMDQTHIGYTSWQQPDSNIMPPTYRYIPPKEALPGLWVEGSENFYPKHNVLFAPEVNSLQNSSFALEIFNRGQEPFSFSIRRSDNFVLLSKDSGTIIDEQRIHVWVDWSQVPLGKSTSRIWVEMNHQTVTIEIPLLHMDTLQLSSFKGFVATNGYVAMEAPHYQRAHAGKDLKWKIIDNLGRTHSAMLVKPSVFSFDTITDDTPYLEYRFYSTDTGKVTVETCLSPTLNFNENNGLRYAISIDNEMPQIVNMNQTYTLKQWEKWVADNILKVTTRHHLTQNAEHTLKLWLLDGGIVLQRIVIDLGAQKPSYLGPPESFLKR